MRRRLVRLRQLRRHCALVVGSQRVDAGRICYFSIAAVRRDRFNRNFAPLERLAGPGGPLKIEPADTMEIAGLTRSGMARLADAANASLAVESRFDLAYNAAHALCLAALRRRGFRATNRYIVFQVLPHTLGLGPEVWRVLAKAHELRNLGEYEGDLDIDMRVVIELIAACGVVADKLSSASQ